MDPKEAPGMDPNDTFNMDPEDASSIDPKGAFRVDPKDVSITDLITAMLLLHCLSSLTELNLC